MKHVKFQLEHEITVNGTDSRVFPKGWQGEIDDETAAAAIKAKAAVEIVPEAIEDAAAPAPVKAPKAPKAAGKKAADKAGG